MELKAYLQRYYLGLFSLKIYKFIMLFHLIKMQVIAKMKALAVEDSISTPNNTFLLDVDSR